MKKGSLSSGSKPVNLPQAREGETAPFALRPKTLQKTILYTLEHWFVHFSSLSATGTNGRTLFHSTEQNLTILTAGVQVFYQQHATIYSEKTRKERKKGTTKNKTSGM